MKLADANPGDFLVDATGGIWLRGRELAVCLHDPADKRTGDNSTLAADPFDVEYAEGFGPFVRLVPEGDTP